MLLKGISLTLYLRTWIFSTQVQDQIFKTLIKFYLLDLIHWASHGELSKSILCHVAY